MSLFLLPVMKFNSFGPMFARALGKWYLYNAELICWSSFLAEGFGNLKVVKILAKRYEDSYQSQTVLLQNLCRVT